MIFGSEIPELFLLCCVHIMSSLISSLIGLHMHDMLFGYETTFHFQHFSYYNSFFVFQCLSDASQPCVISRLPLLEPDHLVKCGPKTYPSGASLITSSNPLPYPLQSVPQ